MNSGSAQSDLHFLLIRLQQIYQAIKSFNVSPSRPPVIDASTDAALLLGVKSCANEALPGLRLLREEVRRDCNSLRQFLDDNLLNGRGRPFSTNAPYLIAVWKELVHAHRPTAIYRSFPLVPPTSSTRQSDRASTQNCQAPSGKAATSQNCMVKVDVVADNGTRWIRVNTMKNSRLMMEFHEMDSYLTSSDDEQHPESSGIPKKPHTTFDNSILKMGRDLLAAARANPVSIPSTSSFTSLFNPASSDSVVPDFNVAPAHVPRVTLRLTRLDPYTKHISDSEDTATDPRISYTIDALREMGVDVELGERDIQDPPAQRQGPEWEQQPSRDHVFNPTLSVNLDLSALIALASDITHSPVPATSEEAYTRFVPPDSYVQWKRERVRVLTEAAKTLKADKPSQYANDGNSLEHGGQTTGNTGEETVGEEDAQTSTWEISDQHSRALAVQAIQDMKKGLLEEIREWLSVSCWDSGLTQTPSCVPWDPSTEVNTNAQIQFWTTPEARDRCIQIVSKIGGKREKQRAGALLDHCFGTTPVQEQTPTPDQSSDTRAFATPPDITERRRAYWEHSRYPAGFLPLVPVSLFKSVLPKHGHINAEVCAGEQGDKSPFVSLASTCWDILERGGISMTEAAPACPSWPSSHQNQPLTQHPPSSQAFRPSGSEILPVRHVHPSLKLTAHTLSSLIAGASRGWTTLTTNRNSVKAVMGEMRRRGVDESWGRSWDDGNPQFKASTKKAALWVVDPRSLAEGMRSDLEAEA